jgi:hypothetical protein
MKLPIPFLSTKKTDSDYYLALIITDEKASAIVLRADGQNIKTIGSHEEFFPDAMEELTSDDFINSVDRAISRAEEVLPSDVETHKTVFGVKESWVEKETKKIKKEYLDKLKKVCDALDLSPIGFMVTTEAVTHLIQDEEGAPLSAVFADIGKKQITLNLLRGGKVLETVTTARHESAAATVDKLLSHFTVPVLPARIVLFLNKPDAEANQAFISHQWSKSLPFLHMPQVTVLPKGFETRAVMFGAASQMGFTVVDAAPTVLAKLPTPTPQDEEAAIDEIPTPVHGHHKETHEDEEKPTEETDEKPGDFGFVVDGEPQEKPSAHHKEESDEQQTHFSEADNNLRPPVYDDYVPQHHREEPEHEEKPSGHNESKFAFLSKLPVLPKNLKFPKLAGFKGLSGKKAPLKIIIPIVALLLLIGGTAYYYLYNVKATVTLTVSPNMVTQDETVTFSVGGSNDFSNNKITARSLSASLPATASTNATGKKDVGEKAKGTITVYNNSDNAVTLNSGAEVKASNGKVFTLDKDVKLAAASGDIFTGTKPGTADSSVTAKDLGTEGNLPSGTKFTVGSSTEIAARNDNAFSGGTTKTVTVVSKADITKLQGELLKSIQGDAKSKLAQQAQGDETVLPVTSNPSLAGVKFDKKEGDEASKLTATANVVFTGMAYQNSDLKEYAKTILEEKNHDDTTLDENKLAATVKSATAKGAKDATASVSLEGGLLPKINSQDVIDNIKDKSLGKARELIANLPQVTSTNITFSPPLPLIPNLFPRLPQQISVEVKTE